MPAEVSDNNTIQGEGNNSEIHAENQQAKTIVNANTIQGNVIVNNFNVPEKQEIPLNKFLCRNLLTAIQEYSPKAKNFLEYTIDDSTKDSWENQGTYLNKAKDIIISSYASVLGDFLKKLIASKIHMDYFVLSQAITKRTLQLLCFSFISSLWDQPDEKKQQLKPEQLKQLKRLFFTGVEPEISYYGDLFKALVSIFQELQLAYPFEEIKNLESDFNGENIFINTCKSIDTFRVNFENDQSLPEIADIEKELTTFLVALNFLADYKMVSVKAIGYEAVRNTTAQFLHSYTPLGVKDSVNQSQDGGGRIYSYQDTANNTDAVLLIKDTYPEGLSLFPFIIDINALKEEDLVKICFYAWNDDNDKTLVYYDLNKTPFENNDDSVETIKKNKELDEIEKDITEINKSTEKDITGFKANDGEKYKKMKLYEVYKTFQNAKESFFGKIDF